MKHYLVLLFTAMGSSTRSKNNVFLICSTKEALYGTKMLPLRLCDCLPSSSDIRKDEV